MRLAARMQRAELAPGSSGGSAIQRLRETEGPTQQKCQGRQHSEQAAPHYSITHSVNRELTFTGLVTDIITI